MPLITYDTFLRSERRKSWIYLVDLRETHSLRDVLNDPRIPVSSLIKEIQRFDPPVIASTGKLVSYISRERLFSEHFFFWHILVKLWLLELNPPVMDYNSYHALKAVSEAHPGDSANAEKTDFGSTVKEVLARLSPPQIIVLGAVIGHLRHLIDTTKTEEDNDTYIRKLSLSLGRCEYWLLA